MREREASLQLILMPLIRERSAHGAHAASHYSPLTPYSQSLQKYRRCTYRLWIQLQKQSWAVLIIPPRGKKYRFWYQYPIFYQVHFKINTTHSKIPIHCVSAAWLLHKLSAGSNPRLRALHENSEQQFIKEATFFFNISVTQNTGIN